MLDAQVAASLLFDARWLELPPRPIDQKIFQNEPTLPAIQRAAAVTAFNPAMRRIGLSLDTNKPILRIAVWTLEHLRIRHAIFPPQTTDCPRPV
jgi:hypothetical protein